MLLENCCEILDSKRFPITATDRKEGPYPYYGANGVQDYVAEYIFDDELAAGRLAHLERRLPHRIVGDLIAHAKNAVGAKALNPGNCDLAMKQAMVNAK